jgi:hypothetical protein
MLDVKSLPHPCAVLRVKAMKQEIREIKAWNEVRGEGKKKKLESGGKKILKLF